MFIVNSDGNICEEVKSIKIRDSKNKTEIPISFCENYNDKTNLSGVIINNICFGVYKKEDGIIIFQDIIDALKRGEILFDLRNYEDVKE